MRVNETLSWLPLLLLAFSSASVIEVAWSESLQADCNTGRQLAEAFANPAVAVAVLKNDITLQDSDWATLPAPVVVARNLSLTSALGGPWHLLDLQNVAKKVQLVGGATLRVTFLVVNNTRRKPQDLSPGVDLLLPSPPGETGTLLLEQCAVLFRACYPPDVSAANMAYLPRAPNVPGQNVIWHNSSQAAAAAAGAQAASRCVNDSAAPLLLRCWPSVTLYADVALIGMDLQDDGRLTPTNYIVRMVNTSGICTSVLDADCIQRYTPIGCRARTIAALALASQQPQPPLLQFAAAPPNGRSGEAGAQGGHTSALVPELVGGLAGGLLLLAAAGAVMGCRLRRARRKPGGGLLACKAWGAALNASTGKDASAPTTGTSSGGTSRVELCLVSMVGKEVGAVPPAAAPTPTGPPASSEATDMADGEEAAASGDGDAGRGDRRTANTTDSRTAPGLPVSRDIPDDALHTAEGVAAVVSPQTPVQAGLSLRSPLLGAEVTLERQLLGRGACGRVVLGSYRGQRVAVKVLKCAWGPQPQPQGHGQGQGQAELQPGGGLSELQPGGGLSAALLRSLAQEVEVLGRCRHPNVVRLLAACLGPPRPCLVMELMDTSLSRLLYGGQAQVGLLPLGKVLHIATEISRGLAYLHPTIVHRDLKPSNVLLNQPDSACPTVKIADFGLSRLRVTELPTTDPEVGTPSYMAPECFEPLSFKVSHKADIYSLGSVMAEMLAGTPPWHELRPVEVASRVALMRLRPPLLEGLTEERCPPKLRALIEGCWEADPRRRPAAAEVTKSLLLVRELLARGAGGAVSGGQ